MSWRPAGARSCSCPARPGSGRPACWVEALTRGRPAVVAVDDLHWASPSSRELLEDLLEVTERAPLLVAATLRPDPTSEGWRFRLRVLTDFSHRTVEQPLDPLSDE